MIDIIEAQNGQDLGIFNTQTPRAANILNVQLGALEYAKDLGIDLKYFLSEDFKFENESFKAYLVETLANRGINVKSVDEVVASLWNEFKFNIAPESNDSGLVAR